jgi:gas vesicle protein
VTTTVQDDVNAAMTLQQEKKVLNEQRTIQQAYNAVKESLRDAQKAFNQEEATLLGSFQEEQQQLQDDIKGEPLIKM